jgi:DNA-binding MarR family transcriptional regulator
MMATIKDLESEDRKTLQRLYDALEEVRVIAQHMPVQQVMSLILVALHEGKSLKELSALMDCKMPIMSRQLIDLGVRNRRMEPGYHLVESRQDPMEMRKNQYTLSVRGKHVIKAMLKALSGGGR